MASPKQVNYILRLLADNGYSTRFMDSRFKALGATMRERSGRVEDWVRSRNSAEASELIDTLKASRPYKASADPEVQKLREQAGPDADTAELRKISGVE
jgi:hypothetical protein